MKNIRKFFSLLIIISVIISSCMIVHSASVNFALGAEVIKSGAGSQAKVNDGIKPSNNSNSAYINSINGSNYIGFDLGEEKTIESIIIYESTSATRHIGNFVIETVDLSRVNNDHPKLFLGAKKVKIFFQLFLLAALKSNSVTRKII